MKNLTIKVEDEVLRWAKIRAAELGSSVSRMVGGMLKKEMTRMDVVEEAKASYLGRQPKPLKRSSKKRYPKRDSLHER